jgi:hypothetical protein
MGGRRGKARRESLGRELAETLIGLEQLIFAEHTARRRARLRAQHADVATRIRRLVDRNVEADTAEYRRALAALQRANAAIEEARDDVARVAATIRAVAKAVEILGKVITSAP